MIPIGGQNKVPKYPGLIMLYHRVGKYNNKGTVKNGA